ncbi:MAG: 2-amino-4-hydroxy-6-hydroxymethyldihydropteridine diphosphokinase [Nitrosomonadales bacterium]|jgi:2-amino-4-hydroxy-6-hydroxymethyldihydropteridine diphosphokinase|nr:2-amino-4-hydroxy-6-hydroxymethyldihydropteridine diphosphokinase [Nitrosomonadales bacterium]|tara:strand:- start:1336 stop:1815 length:480 start_codon:yes stop_codon:yes gene_type:complete
MKNIFIGIGSNLIDPKKQVLDAINKISTIDGVELLSQSSLYETAPVGILDQPNFINAAIKICFDGSPHKLLNHLLEIEGLFGRIRKEKNGPRTLDLDILLFNKTKIAEDDLMIPHPRMHQRLFVLLPLQEIAPNIDIGEHGSINDLIHKAPKDIVEKIF